MPFRDWSRYKQLLVIVEDVVLDMVALKMMTTSSE